MMSNVYGQATTAKEILAAIYKQKQIKTPGMDYFARSSNRELNESSAITSNRSREQLNNTIIKEHNNSSRDTREDVNRAFLASESASREVVSKGFLLDKTAPRLHTYRGIAVQHCKPKEGATKQGIKLAITLQTEAHVLAGERLLVTAELKRYDRLREIKPRLDDSSEFAMLLEDMKQTIYTDKDRSVCMGRIHKRGKRAQWYNDCLILATIKDNVVQNVILSLFGEEYTIPMTQELTDAQQPLYLSCGTHGEIVNISNGPMRLEQAVATPFRR